jgi:hypothetical protein
MDRILIPDEINIQLTINHLPGDYPGKFYCPAQFEFEFVVERYFTIEEVFYRDK